MIHLNRFFNRVVFLVIAVIIVCLSISAKDIIMAKYADKQYKKQGRGVVSRVVDGKTDGLVEAIESYLKDQPDDAESMYCLAMVHTQRGDIDKAMPWVKRAVEKGLPPARFIAGPRDLLKPLYKNKAYQQFIRDKQPLLLHGPMVGAVTENSAKFWLRTAEPADVQVLYCVIAAPGSAAINADKSTVVRTDAEGDYTAVLSISNLKPATQYMYRLRINGIDTGPSSVFRTFPPQGSKVNFSIGFGGGAGYTPEYERVWTTIQSHNLTAFLFLGDNVYIDDPKKPAVQKYCYYRRQSQPEYRGFVSRTPIFAIWDDHDFTVNDGWGGPDIEKPAWKRDVWKVFKQNWANPYYAGGEKQPGCWFDFYIGDVHFIMLDCRYYRQGPKSSDNPSMLGPVQKKWFLDTLRKSKGTFKVLASSVPWALNTKPGSLDTWKGYEKEREEVFSFIEHNKINGVVLISADRHRSDAWKIERPRGYDFYEFESSKLTNIHTHGKMPGCLFSYNEKCSFGKLSFDTTGDDRQLLYEIYNIDNEKLYELKLTANQLK